MTIIFIRHSDDGGVCTRAHDCDLTEGGEKLALKVGKQIVDRYGIPDVIYVSPFHRTIQTMDLMLYGLSYDQRSKIEIIYEPRLSRYFSRSEKARPKLHSDTRKQPIPINESYSEFKRRVRAFNTFTRTLKSEQIVWCITHALVYKQLALNNKVDIPEHIPFMHHFRKGRRWCKDCSMFH